ncbi:hypothetical protein B296_00016536 [Ensete ventricosum]|uniref:Uncharacterized protein n=1 Tax=Ensete ventricosum TaxID=4639 RepID=A0A426YX42_ENSVE|nr:hypothetical protein B296_00016536 [Ensete ventricosum]
MRSTSVVGARVGGKGPRVRLERSAARVVGLRSIFAISPPPQETFSRFPIRVPKMRSCVEPLICGEIRLVPKAD